MTDNPESLQKFGYLALSAYSPAGSKAPGNLNNTLPSGIHDITNDIVPYGLKNELSSIGYSSTIYQDSDGNVIIAYRGSQNPLQGSSLADGVADWMGNDIPLVFGDIGAQFFAAYTTYTQVLAYMQSNNMTGSISFTGHSLGGALADFMGALTNNEAYGYETLPVATLAMKVALNGTDATSLVTTLAEKVNALGSLGSLLYPAASLYLNQIADNFSALSANGFLTSIPTADVYGTTAEERSAGIAAYLASDKAHFIDIDHQISDQYPYADSAWVGSNNKTMRKLDELYQTGLLRDRRRIDDYARHRIVHPCNRLETPELQARFLWSYGEDGLDIRLARAA